MYVTPVNTEFQHARTKCARIQTEDVRGTTRTFDAPAGVLQRVDNVFAFDLSQCLYCKPVVIIRQFKPIDQLQDTAFRVDHGSFDRVR